MTDGWAARNPREARNVQAKMSIVNLDAKVGPVPTLVMMVNLVLLMNYDRIQCSGKLMI